MIERTPQIEEAILDAIMDGNSMRRIAQMPGMPSRMTMLRWLADETTGFGAKCARARVIQADEMDDRILDAAEMCDEENYQSTKVRIAAYQWRASKLNAKKYSDRQIVQGDEDAPLAVRVLRVK